MESSIRATALAAALAMTLAGSAQSALAAHYNVTVTCHRNGAVLPGCYCQLKANDNFTILAHGKTNSNGQIVFRVTVPEPYWVFSSYAGQNLDNPCWGYAQDQYFGHH